jgi:hypothetical protein
MQDKSLIDEVDEIKSLIVQRDRFVQSGEPIPNEIEERIKHLFTGSGVDRCASYVALTEKQVEWLEGEIETIKKLKERYESAIQDVKKIILSVMETNGMTKVSGERGHYFSLRNNQSVHINDINKLSEKFKRQKITIEPDKIAIKAMIKSGEHVDGAELVESSSVIIK